MLTTTHPHVYLLKAFLKQIGLKKIVFSPGSRNAPLILALGEDTFFETYSIIDERSAGFFGMGMAKATRMPVAICCSSGSAVVNYYPAVLEAYYQKIPLLVLSADRPVHLIDQNDGQTIRQKEIFGSHVGFFAHLDQYAEPIWIARQFSAAYHALQKNYPVHLNFALEEPLYTPIMEDPYSVKLIQKAKQKTTSVVPKLQELFAQKSRAALVIGQHAPDLLPAENLAYIATKLPVLAEHLGNIAAATIIQDSWLAAHPQEQWEVVFLLPGTIIHKGFKEKMRRNPPKQLIYIGEQEHYLEDMFQGLTEIWEIDESAFIRDLAEVVVTLEDYKYTALPAPTHADDWSELVATAEILAAAPPFTHVHLGNSSTVRWAQATPFRSNLHYYCNRGVSGIDGSISTAIGQAAATPAEQHLVLTGDLGFFYDSNALWNDYVSAHLKIILLNNFGGKIFDHVVTTKTKNYDRLFYTRHNRTAQALAENLAVSYTPIHNLTALKELLHRWSNLPSAQIIELFF